MKIRRIMVGVFMAAAIAGYAQRINPITKAVLDGYANILKEDPKDYVTLYQRGSQYYNLSEYEKALADIEKALQYTPVKESALREQEYSLLADILIQQKEYAKALEATRNALAINPNSYSNVYKAGNVCLYLNNAGDAYRYFQSLQRMQSRSPEAFFGMARASLMQGKRQDAESLMKEAKEADPSNYVTYCRMGDLYEEMGEPEKAATNYLVAYSMANDPTRPLESLVSLSRKNYDAVDKALEYAISVSDSKLPLYYMRASLGLESGNYRQAEESCKYLLQQPDGLDASVYRMLAMAQYAQDNVDSAADNIEMAIKYKPIAENFAIKSTILREANSSSSLHAAEAGLEIDPANIDCLLAGANAAILKGDQEKALSLLNTAIMSDPGNVESLLTRAYLNEALLKDSKLSVMDYNRASALEADKFPEVAYLAIAKAKSGKLADGDVLVTEMLGKQSGPEECYYAAIYYAQTSRPDKAKEMLDRALAEGYQHTYNLRNSMQPGFNISSIRHLYK